MGAKLSFARLPARLNRSSSCSFSLSNCKIWRMRDRVFSMLEREFDLTRRMILAITRQTTLLETNRVLEHSIRLRNPYVDPMSLIQVELLARKRASLRAGQPVPAELDRAITATINGISAGLRNPNGLGWNPATG